VARRQMRKVRPLPQTMQTAREIPNAVRGR
jgi:hypothetical protein